MFTRIRSLKEISTITVPKRHFAIQGYYVAKGGINKKMVLLYRKRLRELSGTLGIKNHPGLETFYPKFDKKHLSEELQQFVTVIPEEEKPMNTVKLLLRGIGYRASWRDETYKGEKFQEIILRLGFPYQVLERIPAGITISEGDVKANAAKWHWITDKISPTDCQEIILQSKNLQRVTQFAAKLKKLRPPEPYKLKGIYVDVNDGKKRTRFFKKKQTKR